MQRTCPARCATAVVRRHVFAYITSHGNETGVVLRLANGVIRPGTLDNALDAGCGSRPTVLVVSACHSGVFLTTAMRQPNRVVLTAAAADRVSFAAARATASIYYDQCLLQQFDAASTWGQLAQATRTCVQNLEKSMGIRTPSAADLRGVRGRQSQDSRSVTNRQITAVKSHVTWCGLSPES